MRVSRRISIFLCIALLVGGVIAIAYEYDLRLSSFRTRYDPTITRPVPLFFDTGLPRSTDNVPALQGLHISAVVAKLGTPDNDVTFELGKGMVGEMRVGLQNHYPLQNGKNADVLIREVIYKYPKFSVAVWYHKVGTEWFVLDTIRWRFGTVF